MHSCMMSKCKAQCPLMSTENPTKKKKKMGEVYTGPKWHFMTFSLQI